MSTVLQRRTVRIPPAVVTTLVFLLLWQVFTMWGPLAGTSVPTATTTIATFVRLLGDSATYSALGQTLLMAVVGFVIAVLLAIPVGILIGLSRLAFLSSKFTIDFFKVIPPIVIIPITILVFGPTIQMGIFLVAFAIVFALAIQTAYGVRDADVVLLETMRCYRMGIVKQIRYARLPSAAPFIAVGIRIAASAALVVAVVAGLIGGAPGLGRAILLSQSGGLSDVTFALVLLLGLLGIAVSRTVTWIQNRTIFWANR